MNYQDTIQSLPVEETEPSQEQMALVKSIFHEDNAQSAVCLFSEFKETLLIIILFLLFSSSQIDEFIRKYVPFTRNNNTFLIGFKCCCVVFLFYMLKNSRLLSKQ